MTKKNHFKKLTACAMFTALICIGTFIQIPIPYLPITLQTMFVIMAGLILGPKYGAAASFVYMLLGLSGIPVFSQGGGIGYIFKASFGFIAGFIFGAFLTGVIIERAEKLGKFNMTTILLASAAGLAVIYIVGCFYMYFILNVYMKEIPETYTGIQYVLMNGFLLFLPREAVTAVLGAVLARRLKPALLKT